MLPRVTLPALFGNTSFEATIPASVTFIMRHFAGCYCSAKMSASCSGKMSVSGRLVARFPKRLACRLVAEEPGAFARGGPRVGRARIPSRWASRRHRLLAHPVVYSRRVHLSAPIVHEEVSLGHHVHVNPLPDQAGIARRDRELQELPPPAHAVIRA